MRVARFFFAAAAALAGAALAVGVSLGGTTSDTDGVMVLNGTKVFPLVLAKGPDAGTTAPDGKAIKPVDYARMVKQPNAVLIGSKAHSAEPCDFRCQANLPESHMTLTFSVVSGAEKEINDMLAEAK